MALDLLCVGLTTLDIVARPIDRLPEAERTILIEGIEIIAAGTAAGAALVAATLGVKAGIAGMVGDDRKGRFVRTSLEEQGVDTALLETASGAPTSTTILAVDSEGRRPVFHALGASFLYAVTDAAQTAAETAKFVHWGGVGGQKLDGGPAAAFLKRAREGGATITCDLISPQPSALDELRRLLPHVDYFLPSATEALGLSGCATLAEAAEFFLALGARNCLIKNGAAGSYLAIGDQRLTLPAHAITPVDTTSCGDSYCAGFIAALLRGYPPVEAARFATTTASLVARGLGTLGILESFDATLAAMTTTPLNEAA